MPRTWYTRPVVRSDVDALSGRTPFAAHAVAIGRTGAAAGAIATSAGAVVAARRPAEWHHRRTARAPEPGGKQWVIGVGTFDNSLVCFRFVSIRNPLCVFFAHYDDRGPHKSPADRIITTKDRESVRVRVRE